MNWPFTPPNAHPPVAPLSGPRDERGRFLLCPARTLTERLSPNPGTKRGRFGVTSQLPNARSQAEVFGESSPGG